MTRTYMTTTTLLFTSGDSREHEVEVEVHFEVTWGTPESGRFGPPEDYDPGSPDECSVTRMFTTAPGHTQDALPRWMFDALTGDDDFLAGLIDDARQDEAASRDSYFEALADERRMEARS